MAVAAYARVSSRHRKTDSQEAEIKKRAEGDGIAPTKVTWFIDKGAN